MVFEILLSSLKWENAFLSMSFNILFFSYISLAIWRETKECLFNTSNRFLQRSRNFSLDNPLNVWFLISEMPQSVISNVSKDSKPWKDTSLREIGFQLNINLLNAPSPSKVPLSISVKELWERSRDFRLSRPRKLPGFKISPFPPDMSRYANPVMS